MLSIFYADWDHLSSIGSRRRLCHVTPPHSRQRFPHATTDGHCTVFSARSEREGSLGDQRVNRSKACFARGKPQSNTRATKARTASSPFYTSQVDWNLMTLP
jgi:hypothetical protein